MSIAEIIRQKQKEFLKRPQESAQSQEYKFILRRYAETWPDILFNAGLTHEEVSIISSAFSAENFSLCQHLLLIAYESRTETLENEVHRLYSLVMDINIISKHKQTLNTKLP